MPAVAAESWKLDSGMPKKSLAIGVLGMPGLTAWAGLTKIATPKAGETLVVAAAYADEGPTLKRIRPRAQGRAYRIRKRTSHITVEVESRPVRSGGGQGRRGRNAKGSAR